MAILPVEQGQKSAVVPDGLHTGMISDVNVTDTQIGEKIAKYLDLSLTVNDVVDKGVPALVKAGYPLTDKGGVSETTMLGQLLGRFNIPVQVGGSVNTDALKGRMCQYQTTLKKTKKGVDYSEVLRDTVKPYPVTQKV